jgi:Zn-finger nucleic acid-binding protein
MDLICPKCQGAMRSYERNGVTVDQCSECRGVFLDRGELERLVDADTQFQQSSAAAAPVAPSYPPQQQHGGHGYGKPHKKRKSFFEEMFD